MAVDCVKVQPVDHLNRMFHFSSNDFNASSTVSTLTRTGHARFRRAPSSCSTDSHGPSTSSQSEHKQDKHLHAPSPVPSECFLNKFATENTASSRSTNSSSIEGSVSNGKQFSSLGIVAPAPAFSSRKPPLPASHRKRSSGDRPVASVHGSGSGCHCCCKRRKIGLKREVRRVPVIGSKVTSIPADNYSWKKYGEKWIDGSPYPRVYYKCSTGRGCPARKRVELSKGDSKMLIVIYDGEHRHWVAPAVVPQGLTGVVVESK